MTIIYSIVMSFLSWFFADPPWRNHINGWHKFECDNRIYSLRTDWWPCAECWTLSAVSLNLCHYCCRQFVDYRSNFSYIPASFPQVLFPQPFGFSGFLLFISLSSQNVDKLHTRSKNHLIPRMPTTVFFCQHVSDCRMLPLGCNGLWSVSCHLQSSSLQRSHDSHVFHLSCFYLLLAGLCQLTHPPEEPSQSDFLWAQCHWPLFLWYSFALSALLLWYPPQWGFIHCSFWGYIHNYIFDSS